MIPSIRQVLPRDSGSLHSRVAGGAERLASVQLRFHPKEIGRLFPQETLSADGAEEPRAEMCSIANVKVMSSWSTDGRATIPSSGQMTVDVDTREGPRRFFGAHRQFWG